MEDRVKMVDKPPAMGRARGRPSHVPTEESRSKVRKLALVPVPPHRIAAALGISETTLQKHYGDILRQALQLIVGQVVAALYQNGLEGDVEAADFFLSNVDGYKKPPIIVEHVLDYIDGEMMKAYKGNSRRPKPEYRPDPHVRKIMVPYGWTSKKQKRTR